MTDNITVPAHVREAVQTLTTAGLAARSTGTWITLAQVSHLDNTLAEATAALKVARRWLKAQRKVAA